MTAGSAWRGNLLFLYGLLMRQRKALGISQAAMAARIGVSLSTFKRFEGSGDHPDAEQLFRWAEACEVDVRGSLVADRSKSEPFEAAA